MRMGVQYLLGTIIPALAVAPLACDCHHLRGHGLDGGPGLADLRGRHDMVCFSWTLVVAGGRLSATSWKEVIVAS